MKRRVLFFPLKKVSKKFGLFAESAYLCNAKARRALSSAGSERLPYKQRVGGSNPSAPTVYSRVIHRMMRDFFVLTLASRDGM